MATTTRSAKETFLETYDHEHATTMMVLRAYPEDRLDLRPHEKCKTARALAWVFVLERGLGTMVFNNDFPDKATGSMPEAPASWSDLLGALENSTADFRRLIESTSDDDHEKKVRFMVAPKEIGEVTRMEWLWFLLHDEIHHRGQFSIYLRMADGRVPSIYGPTADEEWM
jgi:uncharacterized damage-inducible protein DinB